MSTPPVAHSFGCRGSVLRVKLGALPNVEPIVANNPLSPCTTDATGVDRVNVPSTGSTSVTGGPAGSYTEATVYQPQLGITPGGLAFTSVDGLTIPTSSGTITIVGPAEAIAGYRCYADGSGVATGAYSTLAVLDVNGKQVALPGPGQPATIPLGGGAYIKVNEQIKTATSVIERVLDIHLSNTSEIVVGEAEATHTATPCVGVGIPGGGPPPTFNPCPSGTVFDPAVQACVIFVPGGIIVVSPPLRGPTGGTIMTLSGARTRFRSACLFGKGPRYVIVGTNHADRINGTTRAERILGLGGDDRIAGGGGNDCIDGGAGNDHIYAGKGNVRLYGGTGDDRISQQAGNALVMGGPGNNILFTGNGNDTVIGGSGRDRIGVGRGNDHVWGGKGGHNVISTGDGNDMVRSYGSHNTIYLGNGNDRVWGGIGANRIYDPSLVAYVNCGTGQHNIAFVLVFGMAYAHQHGCQQVKMIRPTKP